MAVQGALVLLFFLFNVKIAYQNDWLSEKYWIAFYYMCACLEADAIVIIQIIFFEAYLPKLKQEYNLYKRT